MIPPSRLPLNAGRPNPPASLDDFCSLQPTCERSPAWLGGPLTMALREIEGGSRVATVRARWAAALPGDVRRPPVVVELDGFVDWRTGVVELQGMVASGTVTTEDRTADASGAAPLQCRLTKRELEVAALLGGGSSNADVARALGISPHTARRHTESVMLKLRARSRSQVGPILHGESTPAYRSPAFRRELELPRRAFKDR